MFCLGNGTFTCFSNEETVTGAESCVSSCLCVDNFESNGELGEQQNRSATNFLQKGDFFWLIGQAVSISEAAAFESQVLKSIEH